jgi:outer membrane biosynthesis protein TonB
MSDKASQENPRRDPVRRFALIAMFFGLSAVGQTFAQEVKKDAPAKPAEPVAKPADAPKAAETKPADAKPAETKPPETPKPAAEAPLPSIPPEVEAKLEAARHAVAEAIVAAQDAGLVDTSIDPPPILDILITGRAVDARDLKAKKGVSPEVFGAWFTNYAKPMEGITAQGDVRIVNPSKGLKDFYDTRAGILARHIDAVRKAKAAAAPKPAPAKPVEAKPATPPATAPAAKPAETKPAAKPADAPKPAEIKPAAKPADVKK